MHKYLFFIVLCLSIVACSSSKKIQSQARVVPLTEEEQLKYDNEFIEATKLKLFGDIASAANKLTRCTEINPYDAAAYFQLAEIYGSINDLDNALKNSRLAEKYDPNNIWYKTQLSNLYILKEKPDSAITIYKEMIGLQPGNVDLQLNLAILYLENNQPKKSLQQLKKIEKVYGYTEEVAIAKYQVYLKKNDSKAIESTLKKSIEEFPDELRFYGLLAELYSATGKEKEAQEYYKKLLEVDPQSALGYVSMIEFYKEYGNDEKALEETVRMYNMKAIDADNKVDLYISLTSDSIFFKKHYKVINSLGFQLFEMYPDNLRVRMIHADCNLREKNYEGAKDDLLYITDRIQTNSFLWEQLFYLLNLLQDYETLYESSAKALKYFENNYLFNFFHALSASMLHQYEKAIPYYLTALESLKKEKESDKNVEIQTYAFLGEAYNELKRYAESDIMFEKALTMAPMNLMLLNNYSYYLSLREEKLDVAEKYIKRCIAQDPNNDTYLDTYGWVLYKLGRLSEAIEMIKKAMKNGGESNPEIVDHYCELLTVAGQTDEAYHACKYSIELNNSNETVEEKMESIKKKTNTKPQSLNTDNRETPYVAAEKPEEKIWTMVDEMPTFKNGSPEKTFREWIANNLEYPEECINSNISGRVLVEFVIDKYGILTDIKIIRPVHPILDSEAIKVLSSSPQWNPGKQDGEIVKVKYVFPITFRLPATKNTK